MNQQNSAAQATIPTKYTVDFSHRLSGTLENGTFAFDKTDSVGLMTTRALGILHSLSLQFDGGQRLSDRLISGLIDSAIMEIEDIESTIMALEKEQFDKEVAASA